MSNDVVAALKGLSLHGMAGAWPEVLGTARMKSLDHVVDVNYPDRSATTILAGGSGE